MNFDPSTPTPKSRSLQDIRRNDSVNQYFNRGMASGATSRSPKANSTIPARRSSPKENVSVEAPLELEDEPNAEETPTPLSSDIPKNSLALHKKLLQKLERTITPKDRMGQIYVLTDPKRPHLRKIGRSINTGQRKLKIDYACGLQLDVEQSTLVNYYTRTEGLIHAYLSDLCRPWECKCGSTHGEWFEITTGSATAAVNTWVSFMSNQSPYDPVSRELQPFWKDWFSQEHASEELNIEALRARWDRALSAPAIEHFRYSFSIIWNDLWKFYWQINAVLAWTATFVAFRHPVTFFCMLASVVGTFVNMSNDSHKARHASSTPKRKTGKKFF